MKTMMTTMMMTTIAMTIEDDNESRKRICRFEIQGTEALSLTRARREVMRCRCNNGQVVGEVAMRVITRNQAATPEYELL